MIYCLFIPKCTRIVVRAKFCQIIYASTAFDWTGQVHGLLELQCTDIISFSSESPPDYKVP